MRLVLPATENAVRRSLETIKTGLAHFDFPPEGMANLEIVLAEVLNNIVEHAYADRTGGLIEISLSYRDSGLWCTVLDGGVSMPEGGLPMGQTVTDKTQIADLPEGGFGWFLIRSLADHLAYERGESGNCLSFRVSLDATHSS
ncbi:ATP-binding protein [Celeribacter litoreus]|uniref:ATP-binding protein n=1 Tax=Celeribacter litoreus TaxID=2876714 RepID=UPI001CCD5490|nr:ATP-binding protein [Celeribacter litoreus]MCA0041909.1 ATP-binding protein [Celeribacter litoreus]